MWDRKIAILDLSETTRKVRQVKLYTLDAVQPRVLSVSVSPTHSFGKGAVSEIVLLTGLGVEGDAHCGTTVKHRSRVAQNPDQPNLRQVHLIHSELFAEVAQKGFHVKPGELGENITTVGIDLLSLPKGALLHIGNQVILEVTGLRNPCGQIDHFQKGLLGAVLDKDENGELIRKSGIMSIVKSGGIVQPDDVITLELPPEPHEKLQRV